MRGAWLPVGRLWFLHVFCPSQLGPQLWAAEVCTGFLTEFPPRGTGQALRGSCPGMRESQSEALWGHKALEWGPLDKKAWGIDWSQMPGLPGATGSHGRVETGGVRAGLAHSQEATPRCETLGS